MSDFRTAVSAKLRARRAELQIRQADLAAAAGISQSQLSKVLRGERSVDLEVFVRLCRALDLHPCHIMNWYAKTVGDDTVNMVATRANISQTTLSRQVKSSNLSPEVVVAIADAYKVDVIEALLIHGFITEEHLRRHVAASALNLATDREVAEEVARRLVDAEAHVIFDQPVDGHVNASTLAVKKSRDDREREQLPQRGRDVNIKNWLEEISGGATKGALAAAAKVDRATFNRQYAADRIPAKTIVSIARHYRADPLRGLVAAGYLRGEDIEGIPPMSREEYLAKLPGIDLLNELENRVDTDGQLGPARFVLDPTATRAYGRECEREERGGLP